MHIVRKSRSKAATNKAVIGIVKEWVEKLAEEDYEAAFSLTAHKGKWSPDLIRSLVSNYGSPVPWENGKTFKVTSLRSAKVTKTRVDGPKIQPRSDVRWYPKSAKPSPVWGPTFEEGQQRTNRHALGYVWFDLPLDGEFSDLTALFNIVEVEGGLALQLDNIHVM